MNKKKFVFIGLIIFGIISNILIALYSKPSGNVTYQLKMDVTSDKKAEYKIYYGQQALWNEGDSTAAKYKDADKKETLTFDIPSTSSFIRIDLGEKAATHSIENCYLEFKDIRLDIINKYFLVNLAHPMVETLEEEGNGIRVVTNGNDAYLVLDLQPLDMPSAAVEAQYDINIIKNIIRCVVIDIMLLFFIIFFDKLIVLPAEVWRNRTLVKRLSVNDFKTRYAGNYLGIFWAFVQPVVTVLVYWFVFEVGFRSGAVMEVPFVLWLVSGLVPWFYFSDGLNGGTSSMIEYSYLVKKVVFKISILPIVKVLSNMFVHLFFIGITILLFALSGRYPDLYTLQVLYYSFCMTVFVLGLCYATSAIIVFFRDLGQIINIFLQVGIWMTPIMWQYTMLPGRFQWVLKINPIYYVVKGYRDSLIDKVWFFENLNQTIYFWCLTVVIFGIGAFLFKRLKVHFADVL